ncbi:Uma2 family endonuclease [Hymenobacter psoromatis]|uniref:Uma2 family endonuclease n=1 Tax=Hymenobacter psoromatis TaxID=1484116 RepID=UPI001CBF3A2E|nr:Uma2 family endonuclease [Hymenobacter psoromatis]
MAQAELQQRRYTSEEYFALEATSEIRHEFFEGEVFAMAGESIAHNIIAQNFVLGLRPALRGKKCQVLLETVQLAVEHGRHYTYPDIMVSCDPRDQLETRRQHHPALIVEVLSPSTAAYDRGKKFKQYQKLPSLWHYILVAQTTWRVEWYRRNEASEWVITVLTEPQEVLAITELNLQLTVAEVYEETGVAQLRAHGPGEGAEE